MNKPVDYEAAKDLARDGAPEERRSLAGRTDLPPELLYFLAQDADPAVRRTPAANPRLPRKADMFLAEDRDPQVRAALARKLGGGWNDGEPQPVRELLKALGRDGVLQVRHAIAESLKENLAAPYELIAALARDLDEMVALPVLEHSPLLTESDLIAIIGSGAGDNRLSAIARRSDLAPTVTDALVDSGSVTAITHLLRNGKAQIREETLDRLIDGSRQVPTWQEALVERDGMPRQATLRLAGLLADNLLSRLMERHSLDKGLAGELQQVIQKRVQEVILAPVAAPKADEDAKLAGRIEQLRIQHAAGQLDDAHVLAAVVSHDRSYVIAALHLLAQLPLMIVVDVLRSQSAKAVCSLAWKAGLSPQVAAELQARICALPPSDVLAPTAAGAYPLSASAMEWQIGLFEPE